MNCEEYEILLSARLDGALTPEETARLEAHLASAPSAGSWPRSWRPSRPKRPP